MDSKRFNTIKTLFAHTIPGADMELEKRPMISRIKEAVSKEIIDYLTTTEETPKYDETAAKKINQLTTQLNMLLQPKNQQAPSQTSTTEGKGVMSKEVQDLHRELSNLKEREKEIRNVTGKINSIPREIRNLQDIISEKQPIREDSEKLKLESDELSAKREVLVKELKGLKEIPTKIKYLQALLDGSEFIRTQNEEGKMVKRNPTEEEKVRITSKLETLLKDFDQESYNKRTAELEVLIYKIKQQLIELSEQTEGSHIATPKEKEEAAGKIEQLKEEFKATMIKKREIEELSGNNIEAILDQIVIEKRYIESDIVRVQKDVSVKTPGTITKTPGASWNSPEVQDLVRKLINLGVEPSKLKTLEDAAKLQETMESRQQFRQETISEEYPAFVPSSKLIPGRPSVPFATRKLHPTPKKRVKKPKEEKPEGPVTKKDPTFGLDETEENRAKLRKKVEELRSGKAPSPVEPETVKPEEGEEAPSGKEWEKGRMLSEQEMKLRKIEKEYKEGNISMEDALAAVKGIYPNWKDREIVAKLDAAKPPEGKEKIISQYLKNVFFSKEKALKEFQVQQYQKLSPEAKALQKLLRVKTGEGARSESRVITDVNTLSSEEVDKQLKGLKKQEAIKKEFKDTLRDCSKELLAYYDALEEFKLLLPDRLQETKPIETETESVFQKLYPGEIEFKKVERDYKRRGTIIGKKPVDKNGKTQEATTYAAAIRPVVRCLYGHKNDPYEEDKKTNKLIPREKCKYCGSIISAAHYQKEIDNLKVEAQKIIAEEIRNIMAQRKSAMEEFKKNPKNTENIKQLSTITVYLRELEAAQSLGVSGTQTKLLRKIKLAPIYEEMRKVESTTSDDPFKKMERLTQLDAEERKIKQDTDLVKLQSIANNLQPKYPYEMEELRTKGPYDRSDKSRFKGETVTEKGTATPQDSQSYRVNEKLKNLNIEGDKDGNAIFVDGFDPVYLPKENWIYLPLKDILKELRWQNTPSKFEKVLKEQEVKNQLLNETFDFDTAVKQMLNLEVRPTPEKTTKIKQDLILEQYKYKKLDQDGATAKLLETGMNGKDISKKLESIPKMETTPGEQIYNCEEEAIDRNSRVMSPYADLSIWNIKGIETAIKDRLEYVEEVLKPQEKIFYASQKLSEVSSRKIAVEESRLRKEEELGIGESNPETRKGVKNVILALNDYTVSAQGGKVLFKSILDKYPSRGGERKGLRGEMKNFGDMIRSKETPSKEEKTLLSLDPKKRAQLKQIQSLKGQLDKQLDDLNISQEKYDKEMEKLNNAEGEARSKIMLIEVALDWMDYFQVYSAAIDETDKDYERSVANYIKVCAESGIIIDPKTLEISKDKEAKLSLQETKEDTEKLKEYVARLKSQNANILAKTPEVADAVANKEEELEYPEEPEVEANDHFAKASERLGRILSLAIDCIN